MSMKIMNTQSIIRIEERFFFFFASKMGMTAWDTQIQEVFELYSSR